MCLCYKYRNKLMTHNPRLKHSIYKWKTQSKITSNATVSLLQLYFISVADIQTTHYGFADIIFHTLLAVSFLHSRFHFFKHLLETPDAFVFRQFVWLMYTAVRYILSARARNECRPTSSLSSPAHTRAYTYHFLC